MADAKVVSAWWHVTVTGFAIYGAVSFVADALNFLHWVFTH